MMVISLGKGSRDHINCGNSYPGAGEVMELTILLLTPEDIPGTHLISRATAVLLHAFALPLLWQCHDRGNTTHAPPLKVKEIVKSKFGIFVASYVIENGPGAGRSAAKSSRMSIDNAQFPTPTGLE
jgi:hypothetical protein